MSTLARIANLVRSYRQRLAFQRRVRNWKEVWHSAADRSGGVTLQLRNGLSIRSSSDDDVVAIFNEIFVEQCYTPGWFYRPEPGHVVLDVGANIGVFSLYLHSVAPDVRVFAFEPLAETYERLKVNIAENGLGQTIAARQLAVGRGRGQVRFSGQSGLHSGHEAATSSGTGEAVDCIDLSEVVELAGGGRVDLLKVDTEGAEVEIIAFAPLAVWPCIAKVVVEYHDLSKKDEVIRALERNGYRCRVRPAPGYEHHLGLIYAWRP
jgi:FkbM family methyltransferase